MSLDDVEIHAIDQRVLRDRTSVGSPFSKRFPISLTGAAGVVGCDRAKGHQLDRVDLNLHGPNRVPTRDLHLRPLPQPERDRDLSGGNTVTQVPTKLHDPTLELRSGGA